MKDISQTEKQLCIDISNALQNFFDQNPGTHTLRSHDAYDILAKKGLVERDRHHGIKFREFLNKVKVANAMVFIPQCRPEPGNGNQTNWIFQSAPGKTIRIKNLKMDPAVPPVDETKLSEIKYEVDSLRKRNTEDFDFIQLDTRKNYPRAYEYWSSKEEELLLMASELTDDSFKLSKIFGRQPSVLEKKIKELSE